MLSNVESRPTRFPHVDPSSRVMHSTLIRRGLLGRPSVGLPSRSTLSPSGSLRLAHTTTLDINTLATNSASSPATQNASTTHATIDGVSTDLNTITKDLPARWADMNAETKSQIAKSLFKLQQQDWKQLTLDQKRARTYHHVPCYE